MRDAVHPGVSAVRGSWRPFLFIQAAAVALVVWYYRSPGFRESAEALAAFKAAGGEWFAFAAGAIAGGLVPEVAKAVTGSIARFDSTWALETAHNAAVFGTVGVLVDFFYKLQGFLFGMGVDPHTLFVKTLFDMGAFAPLFCVPFEVAVLEWGHSRYRMAVLFQNFGMTAYRDRVLPAMIPCWAFWIPVLFCVYALPLNLQFPFAIMAEAAWSIIVVFVTKPK